MFMRRHVPCVGLALRILWGLKAITIANRLRLWRKSVHLYLAFLAFTDRERPREQLRWAMISAVLSALYDYDTDWVRTPDPETSIFFKQMDRLLDADPDRQSGRVIARELFRQDWSRNLSAHGLERGSVSLHFYRLVIGSRWMSRYSDKQIDVFGRKLQIVDDILDLERDREAGDLNCFVHIDQATKEVLAREARAFFVSPFFRALEENSPRIYGFLRRTCERKLRTIAPDPSILLRPAQAGIFSLILLVTVLLIR